MDSVVCTIDLSTADRPVVDWAAMIAQRLEAQLCLFHAIHTPSDSLHPTTEFERGGRLHRLREESHAAMEQLMAAVEAPCRSEIVFGEPVESIEAYCRSRTVALIVAGSHGIKGLKRLMVGTVVARMVRVVSCPMLVVPVKGSAAAGIGRLGICCDLTAQTPQLMAAGAGLARAFNSEVCLLHAMAAPLAPEMAEPQGATYSEVQQTMLSRVQEQLLAMVPYPLYADIAVSTHLVCGEAKEHIAELAADARIDILVVGVRRHSAIGRWVVGSTTEAALRKAVCPVLTVPLGP
jgi:nucleotide-binding universal stress UspA family protein